jgi:hypothetical protein
LENTHILGGPIYLEPPFLFCPLIPASPYNLSSLYRTFHHPKPRPTSYRSEHTGLGHIPHLHTPVKITLKEPSVPIVIPHYPLGQEGHMGLKLIIDQLKTFHLLVPVNSPYNTPIPPAK